MTPRRFHEMRRGKDALAHRLGDGESYSLDQLPDPESLHPFMPEGHHFQEDPYRLGMALAESFFKFLRPKHYDSWPEVDGSIGWLYDYLGKMSHRDMRLGFLCHVESLLQLALMYPERLPDFIKRLDAMSNADLQRQAEQALYYEELPTLRGKYPYPFFGADGGMFAGLNGPTADQE